MSIRNLANNQTKDWLNAKFDTLNARQIACVDQDTITVDGDIELQGSVGTIGQKLKKDASNNVAWVTSPTFGDVQYHFSEHEAVPFVTTAPTAVASTFVTPSLPIGTYIVHYYAEITSTHADCYWSANDSALGQLSEFRSATINKYTGKGGFYVITTVAPAVRTFGIDCGAPGGATTQLLRARLIIYRID